MAAVTQVVNGIKDTLHVSNGLGEKAAPKQPDIQYHPDVEKWKARTARRLAEDPSLPNTPLPDGFPKQLESPLVWSGEDWADEKEWVYNLTPEHLKEIDDAVHHFKGLGKALGFVAQETFPLPTLGPALIELSREVYQGRGFFVLRTIPVSSYSPADNALIYAGVSSYVGNLRGVQYPLDQTVYGHIKDLSQELPAEAIAGPAYTTDKQVYHTDAGDVVSLFALEVAAEGGTSRIASIWKVYNEIAKTRPDLIRTLAEPWPFDGFGATPAYTARPLLHYVGGKISVQYARRYFTGYLGQPRSTNIPPLTEAQAEALDTLQFLGEKHALGIDFRKGDIQYVNNLAIFHARDGFRNSAEQSRHLVRLWVRNEELAWETPESLKAVWKRIYFTATPEQQQFPLDPAKKHSGKSDGEEEKSANPYKLY